MDPVKEDAVWKALADPTRRRILETLAHEALHTGALVERFAPRLVRTAVMKHLDVLEAAKLIRIEREGRIRRNHLERMPLKVVSAWLEKRVQTHQGNLTRLKKLAESKPKKK